MEQKSTEAIALSVKDAATSLSVSEDIIRRLIKEGEIPHARIGNSIRILRQDLVDYVHSQTTREWVAEQGRGRPPGKISA